MIDVVENSGQTQPGSLGRRYALFPIGDHHLGVEHDSDDGFPFDEQSNLFVTHLPLMRQQSAAVAMTGPDGALEQLQTFFGRLIGHDEAASRFRGLMATVAMNLEDGADLRIVVHLGG